MKASRPRPRKSFPVHVNATHRITRRPTDCLCATGPTGRAPTCHWLSPRNIVNTPHAGAITFRLPQCADFIFRVIPNGNGSAQSSSSSSSTSFNFQFTRRTHTHHDDRRSTHRPFTFAAVDASAQNFWQLRGERRPELPEATGEPRFAHAAALGFGERGARGAPAPQEALRLARGRARQALGQHATTRQPPTAAAQAEDRLGDHEGEQGRFVHADGTEETAPSRRGEHRQDTQVQDGAPQGAASRPDERHGPRPERGEASRPDERHGPRPERGEASRPPDERHGPRPERGEASRPPDEIHGGPRPEREKTAGASAENSESPTVGAEGPSAGTQARLCLRRRHDNSRAVRVARAPRPYTTGGAGAPPRLRVHVRRLRQELFQVVAPEGAQSDAHGGEALRLRVGAVRSEVLPFGRTVAPQTDAHRREKIPVPALSAEVHAIRPPRQAREEAHETATGGRRPPAARLHQHPEAAAAGGAPRR